MNNLLKALSPLGIGYVLLWGNKNMQTIMGWIEIGIGAIMVALLLIAGGKSLEDK